MGFLLLFSYVTCPVIFADFLSRAPTPLVPEYPCSEPHPSLTITFHHGPASSPRYAGGDVRSLVGCHLVETLRSYRVASWCPCSDARSSFNTGRIPPSKVVCPLLATMLAKWGWGGGGGGVRGQGQSERPVRRELTATAFLHQSLCVDCRMLKALMRLTVSGKGKGRNNGTEVTTRAWHEGSQKMRHL